MTEDRETLIDYRLKRARETLAEAELLAKIDHWNGSVNRLYYSCFYAVTALLLRHGLTSSRHTGVRALFNQHFVRSGAVASDLGELYNRLFLARNHGDYDDLVQFDESQVRPWLSEAARFVEEVERLASSQPLGE